MSIVLGYLLGQILHNGTTPVRSSAVMRKSTLGQLHLADFVGAIPKIGQKSVLFLL
jgi:hypothetical protein